MARGEIGKAKVGIEPDFDQAALFRQVKAATAKIPAINLPVKITARSVNQAVREVNQKKLAALNLPVKISAASVRTAVRDYNARAGKKPAIQVDVKFNNAQIQKALREAYKGANLPATVKTVNQQVERVAKQSADNMVAIRKNMWKNAERIDRLRMQSVKAQIKEEERALANMWVNAKRRDKERIQMAAKLAKAGVAVDRAFGKGRGIGQFAANIVVLRSAFSLVRLSAIGTFFGFIAQAAAGATTAVTALTSAVGVGLTGAMLTAGSGAASLAQGLGVFKIAMNGVKQAIGGTNGLNEALNKTMRTEAFEGLTPSTKEFVKEIEKLKPLARGLQTELQEGLFEGILKSLRIIDPLLDQFVGPLRQTSEVLGDIAVYSAETAKVMSGDLNRALAGNNLILRQLGEGGVDLVAAFVDLLAASQPMALIFAKSARAGAANFRELIAQADASGQLAEFLKVAGTNMRLMISLGRNLGLALIYTFKAALPFGMALLSQLDGVADRLQSLARSERGQKGLKGFFEATMPAIQEFGLFVKALSIEFVKLAKQPGLALMLKTIREDLLPALGAMIGKVTQEFGPVLVVALTQIAGLFAVLASESGPLNNLVFAVGQLAGWLAKLGEEHPRILRVVTAFFLLESALSVIAVQGFLFRMSGLGSVIGAVTEALIGARGLVPVMTRLGEILRSGAGMARFAGIVGLAIAAIAVLVDLFDQLFIRLKNGESFGAAFAKSFSHAVLGVMIDTIKVIDAVLVKLAETGLALAKLPGGEAIANSLIPLAQVVGSSRVGLDGLIGKLEEYQSVVEAVPAPLAGKQTDFASINAQMEKFQKDMANSSGEWAKNFEEAMKGSGSFEEIGIAFDDTAEKTKAATEANKAHSRAMAAIRAQTAGARQELDAFGAIVERQKSLVDALADALSSLRDIQLEGTKAFSDAKFAIDQESKALELQQVQLQLSGASSEDPRIKELQKQLDILGLKAQEVDLTESLQLDPLRKTWDETINPIKELSFETAMTAFKGLTMQHQLQTAKLQKLEAQYGFMESRIKSTERAAQKLSATFRSQVGTLPATALDGGAQAGTALLKGLETGARGELTKGSDLHTLLNKEIPEFIKANKGPISYDQTILVPAGQAIMDGLQTGLRRGFEPVKGYLREVGPSMEEYVPDNLFAQRTAEFLVEVAAGKKPDPKKFFGDLNQEATVGLPGGVFDPRLSFLHRTMSLADTADMAASLAKTFGGGLRVSSLFRPGATTASGNLSDHGFGYAADISNGNSPTKEMDALAAALKPLFGSVIKQLIWRDKDQNRGFSVPGHMNHVHVAFMPAAGFSLMSGKKGKPAFKVSPYLDIFQQASQKFGVPIALLQAVTKAESGFRPNAGSPAGAKGLMQLLPSTFASQHVGSNIFDPKQNIFAGAKYLSVQLRKFKSVKMALAAYNAGPGNAAVALRSFSETIAYVARIMDFLKDFGGFRAMGGPTIGGKTYMVGENGPELWTERRNGHIINNKELTEMATLLREIRDTGGLRQQTTNIQTASQDPAIIAEMLERKRRRKLSRIR